MKKSMLRKRDIKCMLKVKNLNKRFGGVKALSNLSFEITNEKVFGIVGPNGAGKTTLLNVLMGVYPPDSGEIEFQGRSIKGLPPHKLCRMGLAKTHQIPRFFQNLTVLENLLVAVFNQKVEYKDAIECSLNILQLVGLDKLRDVYARSLQISQLRQLDIARALACKPKLLLMDEPAAGTRGREVDKIIEIILKVVQMGVITILVDHRLDVITKVAERVMVMHEGAKIFEGTSKEILKSEIVIKAYLGEAL
jgi:branched-chain amino acid transport system ATP-binding protein